MKVSVVIPTWRRHDLLLDRALPSIAAQTYPDVETVVVSDGPDPDLAARLFLLGYNSDGWPERRFAELPDHDLHPDNWGSHARNHGLTVATGDLIAYLDDDNTWRPDHLERLVKAMDDRPDAEFGYSRMQVHPHGHTVGSAPPAYGQLDSSVLIHRRGLPQRLGMWPAPGTLTGDQHAPDWGVVACWLAGGATWVFVDQVTVDYHFAGGSR